VNWKTFCSSSAFELAGGFPVTAIQKAAILLSGRRFFALAGYDLP
jgi:hypothetical protein